MEVVPEYEKIRMKNIEDRRAMMIKHLEEIGVLKKQIISGHAEPRPPATKRRKVQGKPVTATSQQGGRRTRRIEKTSVLGKEVKADPNWANLIPVGLEVVGERRSLRKRKSICYAEADLPDLDNYLYCDFCDQEFIYGCTEHRPNFIDNETALTWIQVKPSGIKNAGRGIWNVSGSTIPIGTYFGPYNGKLFEPADYESVKESGYAWEIVDSATKTRVIAFVDPGHDPDVEIDWLALVNSANLKNQQNVVAVQYQGKIFYRVCREIKDDKELLTYYGDSYFEEMGGNPHKFHSNIPSQVEDELVEVSIRADAVNKVAKDDQAKPKNIHNCPACPYTASLRSNLERHVRTVHEKIREFVCTECDKSFGLKSNLDKHFNVVHLQILDFVCTECDKSFGQKSSLDRHFNEVHLQVRDFVCTECDKSFGEKSTLDRHFNVVHLQIRHPCPLCSKTFSQKGQMRSHMKKCNS